jgi:hypothetical protein
MAGRWHIGCTFGRHTEAAGRHTMPQFSIAAHTIGPSAPEDSQADGLFKDDRPRRIDRFIDYFGDAAARASDGTSAAQLDRDAE